MLIDKIFDPYFSTKQSGSGLGLAIVHAVVSKHNGHIRGESIPDVGTTFILSLPAASGARFDCVIMDLTIPGQMGEEAVSRLLREDPAAPASSLPAVTPQIRSWPLSRRMVFRDDWSNPFNCRICNRN